MDVFDLVAKISIDDAEYEKGLNNASSKNDGLKASTIAMGELMAKAFEKVISKVAEYGAKVVEVGKEQEVALAKVKTIMDSEAMSVEDMSAGIKNLSSDMGISVGELSDSVYNIISATGDTAGALKVAEQASKLATAGFTDTGSAVGMLTTALNVYGDEAGSVTDISDSLMTVQNRGVTTVGELSSSMAKAMATAGSYGVKLHDLESAYISVTKQGIPTAETTTYLSSMINELGKAGTNVSGILQEKTGKTFGQLMGEGNNLADVLEILKDSVNGDSEAFANLWGSAEAGKSANAILKQGTDYYRESLEELANATEVTETAYETMADTFQHKTDVLKTSFENFGADIFNNISDGLGGGLDMVMSVMSHFTSMMSAEGELSGTEYVLALVDNFLLAIYDKSTTITKSGMDLIKKFIEGLNSRLPSIIQSGMLIISDFIIGIAKSLPTLIPTAIDTLITIVDALMDNIDLIIDAGIELILGLVYGLVDALPKLLDEAPIVIEKLYTALVRNFPKILEAGINLILAIVEGLVKALPKLLLQMPIMISSMVKGILEGVSQLKGAGTDLIEGLWNGIKERWDRMKDSVKGLADNLISTVKGIFGIHSPSRVFAGIGEMLVAGLNEGSEEMFSTKGLHANVSADVKGNLGTEDIVNNAFNIDYKQLGASVAEALAGFSINMDGRTVAQLIAGDVNYQLGVLNARRV